MELTHLQNLVDRYEASPKEYHATRYWQAYKEPVMRTIKSMDLNDLRSDRYPFLAGFGFNESIYRRIDLKTRLRSLGVAFRHLFMRKQHYMPYSVDISDIREMAVRHATVYSLLTRAKGIDEIEASDFGNPADFFSVNGKSYTMQFLSFFIRYCFVQNHVRFVGDEVVVELGSGSGHQVEILKKLYPEMTILCFDLPGQIFLCEKYIKEVLGSDRVIGSARTMDWTDLGQLEKGKVHFLGNWQMPLVSELDFDIFWNAASFGEMEPEVVQNYLSFVKGRSKWIYLLQAEHGKEEGAVENPITFDAYQDFMSGYELIEKAQAFRAHMRLKESKGYFQAIWKNEAN